MITYLVGDIIDSNAECLVNTVNCEGFMGKGIAYQFKLKFPENEKAYKRACRKNEIYIGKVFMYKENDRIIANFPTKNEWRKNSEYSYIQMGMADLVEKIHTNNIKSIAIPPLGCGNGGLEWHSVKEIIESSIDSIKSDHEFFIFQPSMHYKTIPTQIPKLTASHLILLSMKGNLNHFSKVRLQKTAFFMCLFAKDEFFKFEEYNLGPYSHAIDICSRNIKEFQDYYNISSGEAEILAKKNLISENVQRQLEKYAIPILQATTLINSISEDSTLEVVATLTAIIKKQPGIDDVHIIDRFYNWSEAKQRYKEDFVIKVLNRLVLSNIVIHSLLGYEISPLLYDTQKLLRYNDDL